MLKTNPVENIDLHFYTIGHDDHRGLDLFVFELGFDLFTCQPPAKLTNVKCLKTGITLEYFLKNTNVEQLPQLRVVDWQELTPFDFDVAAKVLVIEPKHNTAGFVSEAALYDTNPETTVRSTTFIFKEKSGKPRAFVSVD